MRVRRVGLAVTVVALHLATAVRPAAAQAVISVNDAVNIRFGALARFRAHDITDPDGASDTCNLFVRRLRLITGGQVAKGVAFFIETDAPNLGRTLTTKNITPSVMVLAIVLPLLVRRPAAPAPHPMVPHDMLPIDTRRPA